MGRRGPIISRTQQPTRRKAVFNLNAWSQQKAARKLVTFSNTIISPLTRLCCRLQETQTSNDSKKKKKRWTTFHSSTYQNVRMNSGQDSSKESQELKNKEKEERAGQMRKQKARGAEAASQRKHSDTSPRTFVNSEKKIR